MACEVWYHVPEVVCESAELADFVDGLRLWEVSHGFCFFFSWLHPFPRKDEAEVIDFLRGECAFLDVEFQIIPDAAPQAFFQVL